VALAVGAVVAATVVVPSYGDDAADTRLAGHRDGSLADRYEGAVAAEREQRSLDSTGPSADGHDHDHSDLTTKNAISRSGEESAETADPTSPAERMAGVSAVAAQRAEPDPELIPVPSRPARDDVPQDRYAMARGCYALQDDASGRWVARQGEGFAATKARRGNGEPFHFQATDLGRYLLFGTEKDFLARADAPLLGGGAVESAPSPSPSADWTARRKGATYTFSLPGSDPRHLGVGQGGTLEMAAEPARFRLHTVSGCARWPEIGTSTKGRTFRGVLGFQETRGYVDAHTHGMAWEFLGGEAHCGRPWHPYGVTHALVDCEDHTYTGGYGGVLESALSGRPNHDPVGWPTFKDWPAPDSLTHEGTYYTWMERAWRGGLRLFVNLLVENNQLCQLYPFKRNSCDDMDSIRLQAKDMRLFERYIDAQYGGPGEGWYRIVTNPFQARRVVNQGKLAVVMGIETSIPFKCTMKLDVPQCDKESIDAQLAEVHAMGVRQMELINKFDNALSGVAGDNGQVGVLVNSANFLETGSFWAMEHCEPEQEGVHDREQYAAPEIDRQQQDALFGAIYQLSGPQRVAPVYDSGPHCNQRGLTELGEHLVTAMAERGMVFDPDHMSVAGRQASLDLLERLDYPGVVSSHSWSTPDA
jgi:microsomal dipeptidase-like Zn-dependent dipeptidase